MSMLPRDPCSKHLAPMSILKMLSAGPVLECCNDRATRLTFSKDRPRMTVGGAAMCVLEVSASDGAGRCYSRFGKLKPRSLFWPLCAPAHAAHVPAQASRKSW